MEYFVNYCEYVAKANSIIEELKVSLEDLNNLSLLISEFKIKVSETHKLKILESNNNMTQLKKKLEDAATQYD